MQGSAERGRRGLDDRTFTRHRSRRQSEGVPGGQACIADGHRIGSRLALRSLILCDLQRLVFGLQAT